MVVDHRGGQGGFYNRWVQYISGDITGYTHNHIMRICMLCSIIYIYCLMLCCIMLYYICYVMLCLFLCLCACLCLCVCYVMSCHGMFSLCIISCLFKSYVMLSPWGF